MTQGQIAHFVLAEADTCCAPRYEAVTLKNAPASTPSFVFIADVNGHTKQKSDVDKLIWNIREIIEDLSLFYHLQPGDLIYTGTPEGVGAAVPGDRIEGSVEGVGAITLNVGPAEA